MGIRLKSALMSDYPTLLLLSNLGLCTTKIGNKTTDKVVYILKTDYLSSLERKVNLLTYHSIACVLT